MTLRERIEKLAEMYEAEIAEDRRVAALPDTWPDTRSTITCLAIRTERCAADLRALLAADEGGDAATLHGQCARCGCPEDQGCHHGMAPLRDANHDFVPLSGGHR